MGISAKVSRDSTAETAETGSPRAARTTSRGDRILFRLLGIIVLAWLAYTLYAPHRQLGIDEMNSLNHASLAVTDTLAKGLALDTKTILVGPPKELAPADGDYVTDQPLVRIEPRGGNNLEVYLPRATFESVPFPDRDQFVKTVGEAWCNNTGPHSHYFLPAVELRDVRTADELGSYSCFGMKDMKELLVRR
ncbi:MAG TPA: hypothetical protein VEJ46_10770 [Candidatus Acidoferrum sp.]|nr:hypothetical protein [Candidatus Acidoferrum sp.]